MVDFFRGISRREGGACGCRSGSGRVLVVLRGWSNSLTVSRGRRGSRRRILAGVEPRRSRVLLNMVPNCIFPGNKESNVKRISKIIAANIYTNDNIVKSVCLYIVYICQI